MDLDSLRKKIDTLDREILERLNERARVAQAIGKIKEKKKSPIYVPAREEEVFNKILRQSTGPLPEKALRAIFREIISASISTEKDLHIAYLGSGVSFTKQAAIKNFGSSVAYQGFRTIEKVFEAVENSSLDFGVVPIESFAEGTLAETLDCLKTTPLKIVAEIQDPNESNMRFFVLGHKTPPNIENSTSKTTLRLGLKNTTGSLAEALQPFAAHNIDITHVETRPKSSPKWEYHFFVDFIGHWEAPEIKTLVQDLEAKVDQVHWLGSYPIKTI